MNGHVEVVLTLISAEGLVLSEAAVGSSMSWLKYNPRNRNIHLCGSLNEKLNFSFRETLEIAPFNHQRAAMDLGDRFSAWQNYSKDTKCLALVCMPAC